MTHQLLTLALAPVLLIQGKSVRRNTPKLPEPPGARQGRKGSGAELRLLILGDSAAAGVGAEHQNHALLGQLVNLLAKDYRVSWALNAATGATTHSTLEALKQQEAQDYDVIVTSLGVNDVTSNIAPHKWQKQQAVLRQVLQEKFQPRLIVISGLPPMAAFPALPQPLRWYLGRRAKCFNRILKKDLCQYKNIRLLIQNTLQDSRLMASDGFHPGPDIYTEWALNVAEMVALSFTGIPIKANTNKHKYSASA